MTHALTTSSAIQVIDSPRLDPYRDNVVQT